MNNDDPWAKSIYPSHDCPFFQMKIDGKAENCPCQNPDKIYHCNCENSQCDHERECKRPAGRGWIQYLGGVCEKCFFHYPAKYRLGPGPIISGEALERIEELIK